MRRLLLAVLFVACSIQAQAQSATGTLGALNATVELDTSGKPGSAALVSTADLNATVVAEVSLDNTNWASSVFIAADGTVSTSLAFTGIASVRQVHVAGLGGTGVRLRVSVYTAGTANVTLSSMASVPTQVVGVSAATTSPISGTVAVSNFPATQPISAASLPLPTGAATEATLATRAASAQLPGALGANGGLKVEGIVGGVAQPVSGPLTDAQIRATPVPVSGTVAISGTVPVSGPLTDAQLRASAVPVSIPIPAPISDNGGSVTVDSTQLPAALAAGGGLKVEGVAGGVAQPISAASLPLPTGAATETTLATRAADATITNRLPAGSTPADNESNAATLSRLGVFNMVFDGSAWDRWTGGVSQIGTWTVTGAGGTFPVTGTFWPTTAGAPASHRLSDGAAFYDATKTGQLPAALVGSRLDINLGAIGGTAQSGAQIVDVGNTAWRVNCVVGCGSSSFADNSAFTFNTTPVANQGFVVDDTATNAVAENSAGAPRMSTSRIPYSNPRTAAGVEIPFPSALVGGRLDVNLGSWLGSTAPTVGSKTSANSVPVVIASDQGAIAVTPAANSSVNVAQIAGGATSTVAAGVQKVGVADSAGNAIQSAVVGPSLTDRGLEVRVIDSERTTSGVIDGAVLNSAVTISGEGSSSITASITTGLNGAGFLAFEGTVNGADWIGVPIDQYFSANALSLPSNFNVQTLIGFPGGSTTVYKFQQPGFLSYRVRVATAGAAGTATVVLSASAATSEPVASALYYSGSQSFDLTIPGNSITLNTKGASMIAITWSATLGASTMTPKTAGNQLACYQLGSNSAGYRLSWTGVVNGITWVCPLYGANSVQVSKDVGIGAGTSVMTFYVSMANSTPAEDNRPVTEWVSGSSPTTVLLGSPKQLMTPEGQFAVTLDHPRRFNCTMNSTAVAATVVTGCGAPGAGLTRYITGIEYSSSIISTTANFMIFEYGTGATCGTGTTVIWQGSNVAAFSPRDVHIGTTPIRLGTNTDLCFLHPGAGTRWINVRGFVAP